MRALVVDDDASSASAIGQLLSQAGCSVSLCTDPESAITIALDLGVDLVSLDIRMPRLDGFEVLSLIRSHEYSRRWPSVPVIAITGNVSNEDKAQAIAAGFAAHLGKPVLLEDLQLALRTVETLRDKPHHTRYSADQAAITSRLGHLLAGARSEVASAVAGLALAMEQQGAELLRQMLESAYRRDIGAASEAAARLADVASAVDADHFASLCNAFIAALDCDSAAFERSAVLARAELDRIVYTLRERVLP